MEDETARRVVRREKGRGARHELRERPDRQALRTGHTEQRRREAADDSDEIRNAGAVIPPAALRRVRGLRWRPQGPLEETPYLRQPSPIV